MTILSILSWFLVLAGASNPVDQVVFLLTLGWDLLWRSIFAEDVQHLVWVAKHLLVSACLYLLFRGSQLARHWIEYFLNRADAKQTRGARTAKPRKKNPDAK